MENNNYITSELSRTSERPERVNHSSLPVIKLGNRQLRDISKDCWTAVLLLNEKDPAIFVKKGKLVRLRDRGEALEIGAFSLDEMVGLLTRKADWVYVSSSGESKSTKPDKDAVRDMLCCVDEKIPELESVVTTPLFNRNGKLLSTPGFHKSDAIYLDPKRLFEVPQISQHPSSQEIADAISLLMTDTLGDFAFAGPSDKAHALGALLLPFVRELIPGPAPLHGIEAPVPGSGKTLFVQVVACICSGQEAQTHTLPNDESEMRKKITAELIRGPQLFIFDNVQSGQTISEDILNLVEI